MRLLLILALCGIAFAKRGFDGIAAMSKAHMECMKKEGYEFFMGRIYRSNGAIDKEGIENIRHAREGGLTEVDAYIFPCHSSSCGSAKKQVEEAVKALKEANAEIGVLWMDIERYNWPKEKEENRKFILELVEEAKALGYTPGIYAGYYEWEAIAGLSWEGVKAEKLWWPDYDHKESFAGFKPFGGWKEPSIHQYEGTSKGPCSFNLDKSWKP